MASASRQQAVCMTCGGMEFAGQQLVQISGPFGAPAPWYSEHPGLGLAVAVGGPLVLGAALLTALAMGGRKKRRR